MFCLSFAPGLLPSATCLFLLPSMVGSCCICPNLSTSGTLTSRCEPTSTPQNPEISEILSKLTFSFFSIFLKFSQIFSNKFSQIFSNFLKFFLKFSQFFSKTFLRKFSHNRSGCRNTHFEKIFSNFFSNFLKFSQKLFFSKVVFSQIFSKVVFLKFSQISQLFSVFSNSG